MTGTVEFVQGKPTDNYLQDISRRALNLATTYSPATARAQFEDFLFYFAPESYPDASKRWYSLASRIEESMVSSVFYLENIKLKENTIEMFGNLRQFTNDTQLENTTKTYLLDYRLQDGRFYVVSFEEKFAATNIHSEEKIK
jgi:conjugal transfer pilus assembly protein TraE